MGIDARWFPVRMDRSDGNRVGGMLSPDSRGLAGGKVYVEARCMKLLDELMALDASAIPHGEINSDPKAVRLFRSRWLEFFTHVTPQAVVLIWLPVVGSFVILGVVRWPEGFSAVWFVAAFASGVALLWTLMEYILHRFVFHFEPRNKTQAQILFLFHGIHHFQPHIKTRLVMPPVVSVPLAIFFYVLFWLVLDVIAGAPYLLAPVMAGTILGYIAYDMVHYATHHLPMKGAVMRFLKRHHMEHHFRTPEMRFGVTTSMWDQVFRTEPPRETRSADRSVSSS